MTAARTYQTVLRRIEDDLAAGRLSVGGRLPGERQLAVRYEVSRSSIREAIRVLEAMGMVRTAAGSGPEAGAVIISDPAAPIGSALRWHLASHHLPVADLVDSRVLIEAWAVAAAARQAAAPLQPLVELLDRMDRPGLSSAEFLTLDTRFHVALAELAGNVVVTVVMTAMREAIEQYVTAAVADRDDWDALAGRLRAEHRGVLDAVRDGDGALAARRVTDHIQGFYATTGLSGDRERT